MFKCYNETQTHLCEVKFIRTTRIGILNEYLVARDSILSTDTEIIYSSVIQDTVITCYVSLPDYKAHITVQMYVNISALYLSTINMTVFHSRAYD